MKHAWLAAALLALSLTGTAGAEEALPQKPSVTSPLAAAAKSAGEDALDTVLSADNHSYLEHLALPGNLTYKTLPIPVEAGQPGLAGLLTMKGKNASVPILAIGWDRQGPKADETFGGMFVPGGHTQEAGERMLAFNMALVNGANISNNIFLLSLSSVDASLPAAERLPYDFITLDMGKVEQLHKEKNFPDTYTFSAHPAIALDGWVIPLYVRGAITKLNGSYRFLLLTSLDSTWQMTDEAAEDILNAYTPVKK